MSDPSDFLLNRTVRAVPPIYAISKDKSKKKKKIVWSKVTFFFQFGIETRVPPSSPVRSAVSTSMSQV